MPVETCQYGTCLERKETNPLLVGLVDSVHGVLDSNTLHAPCGDLEPQGEVQVNFLDRRVGEVNLENVLVLDCHW